MISKLKVFPAPVSPLIWIGLVTFGINVIVLLRNIPVIAQHFPVLGREWI
jgi:hypothetical protein